ncbi:branched-chain amino acid ABC transporter permease [Conexibacter woesei]|uniref:Inner-membrane translocator n=1 Tax=Conexibacter woesei (strain DSM 14684 / CCUG 47730 / CIP 108061 / JCM 11494 / NBRC 100937 / ID131577) TaxID=469383 RepID=D3FAP5_CONWI|nr:branched-chain amino acid ABC transporter permease [Conexibacter woesei]ADB51208.1 inner-membrane translocator [Conexibacter woesei DSM 14684]
MNSPLLRSLPTLIALVALVVLATVVGSTGGPAMDRVVTVALMNLVLVVGLWIFVGNSGVFSFGHVGFAAIGAYAGGLLTIPPEQKPLLIEGIPSVIAELHASAPVAVLAGGLLAALVALVLSFPLMRLNGLAAAMSLFAVLVIVNVVLSNWNQLTNGTGGISGIPATTTTGTALVWAIAAIAIAFVFQQTRWALRLRATREDEPAARAAGIGVLTERSAAFVLSAFVAGVAGALYGQFLGSITPGAFYLSLTFTTMVMLVVGGMRSLSGAVLGAIAMSFAAELLRQFGASVGKPSLRDLGLALIMVAILVIRPQGLLGERELDPRRFRRSERSGAARRWRPGRAGGSPLE